VIRNLEKGLKRKFGRKESFSRRELFDFLKGFDPEMKEGTLSWRIYDLKKNNIIRSVRRGKYTISSQPEYEPEISRELLKLGKFVAQQFENIQFCLWETSWINEFSRHQSRKKLIIIEIEKEFIETLYYKLQDGFSYDLFLNPDEKTIEFYVSESPQPVIIKKLITRSPVVKRTEKKVELYIPKLEKLLVDLYSESKLFYFYQGAELTQIFENALKHYPLNYTTILSYAGRREKEEEIRQFLTDNLYHLVKDIIS
jgi:hypothetical protein